MLSWVCYSERKPSFSLKRNVDLMQQLSLGQVPFFVISQVLYLTYIWKRKYVNMEFGPEINYLGFLNSGEFLLKQLSLNFIFLVNSPHIEIPFRLRDRRVWQPENNHWVKSLYFSSMFLIPCSYKAKFYDWDIGHSNI